MSIAKNNSNLHIILLVIFLLRSGSLCVGTKAFTR